MATKALAPVEREFAGWFATLSVGDDGTLRGLRHQGVIAAVAQADAAMIETWVRLAFKSKKSPSSAAIDAFRVPFGVDETFPTSGNARELQVLAAICLAQMMESGNWNAIAALAVTTASCQRARAPKLPMDLVSRAEATILEIAEIRRSRPDISRFISEAGREFDFAAANEKITTTPSFAGVEEALTEAAGIVRIAFDVLIDELNVAFGKLGEHIEMKDEELQMLWWLTGSHSVDLDCDFSVISADAQPLVLGTELAALTEILPGPASVKGLLSRAGLKARKKLTLAEAVNAVPLDWVKTIAEEKEFSPVTTPLHFALARRLETGGHDDTWVGNWASVSEIPAAHDMSCLALGVQFYRERLLVTHA